MSNEGIRNRLCEARKRKGMTRPQAAEAMSMEYQTYAGHENGKAGLTVDSAIKYAKFYRVSLDWLLSGNGDAPDVSSTTAVAPIVTTYLRWRRHRFIRQRHAAKLLGIPHEKYARVESGLEAADEGLKLHMLSLFDCGPDELESGPPNHTQDDADFVDRCLLTA